MDLPTSHSKASSPKPLRRPAQSNEAAPFSFWAEERNLQFIQKQIQLASHYEVPVLLTGESGTGKELLAREIWKARREKLGLSPIDAPLIALNSASIPADIAESILFGHERGAFTSARDRQFGRLEMTRRGTLFLDEVQCLDSAIQAKLLRVLESRTFEPLGSRESKKLECQLVVASNIPLEILVKRGSFRKDLFYRLSLLEIYLQPLREQLDGLPLYIEKMSAKLIQQYRISKNPAIHPSVIERFQRHSWPGNFRELEHVLLYALLQCQDDCIQVSDLPFSHQENWEKRLSEGQW